MMFSATVETETAKTWSDDQAAEIILLCLSKRMESVKKGCNTHALEAAINRLRNAIDTGKYTGEFLSWIRVLLIQGLLTRFGLYGWMEDLDACTIVSKDLEPLKPGFKISIEYGFRNPAKSAVDLLMRCRSSFDIITLNKIILIAERSISLYLDKDGDASLRARLLILCGNAWVLKYLHQWKAKNLQHAVANFQKAKDVSDDFVALKLISAASLVLTGLLRYIECDQPEGLLQARMHGKNVTEIEGEGNVPFLAGKSLVDSGNKLQRQQGIELLYASLSHHTESHPRRHFALHNLAKALYERFNEEGDIRDLENCILLNEESLELRPSPRPGRDEALGQLAGALYTRFRQLGHIQDLQKSILLQRESIKFQRTPVPFHLANMAKVLLVRFEYQGSYQDLDEGIDLIRKSTLLPPKSLIDSFDARNDLANALFLRFQHKGTLRDIEESIMLLRDVLASPPGSAGSKDHSCVINNLATFLMFRLGHLGILELDELEEIIKLHKQALKLRPRGNVNRPSSLNNLASAMELRYHWKGTVQDIKECIELYQEALDLRPEGDPRRHCSLINLANAVKIPEIPDISDVQYCIKLLREAVHLQPHSHPDYPRILYTLANALLTAFKLEQLGLEALQECISLHEQAVTLLKFEPYRQMALDSLGDALALRFRVQHEDRDIQTALRHYESAAKYEAASTLCRFFSSRKWALTAELYNAAVALDAYKYTMDLLPLLASSDLTLIQRRKLLRNAQKAVGDAAKWAICQGQLEVAVIFLSNSRSIFWSQALQLRKPVDELAVAHPDLAKRFLTTSRELDLASHSSTDQLFEYNLDTPAINRQGPCKSIHTLAETRRATIEKIRKIKGFEGFLKPPSFASLQVAAQRGPIVLLNTSARGCDALIFRASGSPQHIEISDINVNQLEALKILVHESLGQGLRAIEIPSRAMDILQEYLLRDMVHQNSCAIQSNQEAFRLVLRCLWVHVVQPVVKALGIGKSDLPNRIWWCPTGHFASLPIHAAGDYSYDNAEPIDCLFQYAVSSYCTSAQDLLYSSPPIPPDFKMTVVVEPEAPGAPPLPGALCELVHIRRHIADNQGQMIARLGRRNTSSNINDLISNIQQSSFVHFVCHGMQNLDNPLESYLLTSGGRLTISQIIKECRVPDGALAYLSACETAKTDEQQPDESLNLAATMMFAGFKGVVGTLWSIYDDDAPIVADTFYHHMFRHGAHAPPDVRDAAYALHIATNKLRESGKPFCSWVPYVHYGI